MKNFENKIKFWIFIIINYLYIVDILNIKQLNL